MSPFSLSFFSSVHLTVPKINSTRTLCEVERGRHGEHNNKMAAGEERDAGRGNKDDRVEEKQHHQEQTPYRQHCPQILITAAQFKKFKNLINFQFGEVNAMSPNK